MSHAYKHLILAFQEIVGHKHGATFHDENIDTLHVDGEPAPRQLIDDIKKRADAIAAQDV